MKNKFLYFGLFLIGLSILIRFSNTKKETFTDISGTDISGNSLPTNLANLLNLVFPRIQFNAIGAEPTDITISRAFLDEDQAHLQSILATKLTKKAEESLSSA
uniref:Uncharacterized protein n=1 Tax=viral metagenome TaxID=1070528 RepID=A0A6C0BI41_9ZZZZ